MTLSLSAASHDAREVRARELAELPMVPAGPTQGLLRGSVQSLRDIWAYRELLHLLFRRELKARYKDSVLGFAWSLIRPLALLAVYAIAIGQFLGASRGGQDYPVYVFAGLTIWQLFSEIISAGTSSLISNGGLVKKIYLPREVFPLSTVGSALFNFMMQVVVLVIGCFALGSPPSAPHLGYAVLAVLIAVVYATALALVFSAVNVYLRDVAYLVEVLLMFGMWTAPIVYYWKQVSPHLHQTWIERLYVANPITEAVLGFQRAFWIDGRNPANSVPNLLGHMLVVLGVGIVLLAVCQRVFARLEANFAQEL